jgi:hypothetical protein
MVINFFKKKDKKNKNNPKIKGGVPPDVGKEPKPEEKEKNKEENTAAEEREEFEKKVKKSAMGAKPGGSSKSSGSKSKSSSTSFTDEIKKLEIEKLNARLESINSVIKSYMERFSVLSEQIGEIRSMSLQNEKSIARSTNKSAKAVDIVSEVKPENLRLDYRRLNTKIKMMDERLSTNRDFMETIMDEIKKIRRKSKIFVGTDALLKLNEDITKDMIEMQRLETKMRVSADKSEQLFIELRKGFAKNQATSESVKDITSSYSEMKKDMEKTRLDDESTLSAVNEMREDNSRMKEVINKILSITKKNSGEGREDDEILLNYDKKMVSMLEVIERLIDEVSELKKRLNIKPGSSTGKAKPQEKPSGKGKKPKKATKLKTVSPNKEDTKVDSVKTELEMLKGKRKEKSDIQELEEVDALYQKEKNKKKEPAPKLTLPPKPPIKSPPKPVTKAKEKKALRPKTEPKLKPVVKETAEPKSDVKKSDIIKVKPDVKKTIDVDQINKEAINEVRKKRNMVSEHYRQIGERREKLIMKQNKMLKRLEKDLLINKQNNKKDKKQDLPEKNKQKGH